MALVRPILRVADFRDTVFEDIRAAFRTYRHGYGYRGAFDEFCSGQ